jgi:hypothetical protein
MCMKGDQVPGDAKEALRMLDSALDYLNGPFGAEVPPALLGETLVALGQVSARLAVARAQVLSRFDAGRGHDADGYGSSRSWLAARARITQKAAGVEVRRMRQLRRHPVIAAAQARGEVSESWAAEMAEWTGKLPVELREGTDKLLVDTAAAGANLEDLAFVARAAYERWRSQQPDPDEPDDGFEDRYLKPARSAALSPSAPGTASGPAVVSGQRPVTCTICAIRPTEALPPSLIACFCASSTTMCASTAGAGSWSCTRTGPPSLAAPEGKLSTVTDHPAGDHRTEAGHRERPARTARPARHRGGMSRARPDPNPRPAARLAGCKSTHRHSGGRKWSHLMLYPMPDVLVGMRAGDAHGFGDQ